MRLDRAVVDRRYRRTSFSFRLSYILIVFLIKEISSSHPLFYHRSISRSSSGGVRAGLWRQLCMASTVPPRFDEDIRKSLADLTAMVANLSRIVNQLMNAPGNHRMGIEFNDNPGQSISTGLRFQNGLRQNLVKTEPTTMYPSHRRFDEEFSSEDEIDLDERNWQRGTQRNQQHNDGQ